MIGDGAVGNTCLLITYVTGKFPKGYVPVTYHDFGDTNSVNLKYNG